MAGDTSPDEGSPLAKEPSAEWKRDFTLRKVPVDEGKEWPGPIRKYGLTIYPVEIGGQWVYYLGD